MSEYQLSSLERKRASILVVDGDSAELESIRSSLATLGYGFVRAASDHVNGLRAISESHFTHLLFSAQSSTMPAAAFLERALEMDAAMVGIATSGAPQLDDVFSLLRTGARGFLVRPFTVNELDLTLCTATKGPGFSRAILDARDRNEAFSALIAANIDKLADAVRSTLNRPDNQRVAQSQRADLELSVKLARAFADGGDEALRDCLVQFLVTLSEGPATRLGRLRKRLAEKRDAPHSSSSLRVRH